MKLNREGYLLILSDVLRPLADPEAIQETVTRTAMQCFEADRCYYCEIVGNDSIIRRDASREDLPSVVGTYSLQTLPIFKSVIEAGQPFVVHDAHISDLLDESLRQLCVQLQVISFIDVPVIKNGLPVGILCITQTAPREWSDLEVDLATETAERTWAAVDRAKVELALKASEARLQFQATLLDKTFTPICGTDAQFRINYWNQAAENTFGWNEAEVLGRFSKDVFQTEIPDSTREEAIKVLLAQGFYNGEVYYKHKDGHTIITQANSSIIRNDQGEMIGLVCSFRDITESKRTEEALARSNRRISEILSSIKDDFYVLDRNWVFVYANKQFTGKIGKEPEDFIGRSIWEMFPRHVGSNLYENFKASMEKGEIRRFEVRGQYTDNWYSMTSFPSPEGITVLGSDITERMQAQIALFKSEQALQEANNTLEEKVHERTRELADTLKNLEAVEEQLRVRNLELEASIAKEKDLQKQLVQSEKLAALARLIASVAHEIQNPLQTIQNSLYFLKAEIATAQGQDILEMAAAESYRIGELVAQLRETYYPRSSKVTNFDLVELIKKARRLMDPKLRQKRVKWALENSHKTIPMQGDPDRIQQVILNICLNAVEAMESYGGQLCVQIDRSDHHVEMRFRDTGPGIPPENLQKIFEPFFTTKGNGSGLGLAICYEIVKEQGGEISVENLPGQGACFMIRLPLLRNAPS